MGTENVILSVKFEGDQPSSSTPQQPESARPEVTIPGAEQFTQATNDAAEVMRDMRSSSCGGLDQLERTIVIRDREIEKLRAEFRKKTAGKKTDPGSAEFNDLREAIVDLTKKTRDLRNTRADILRKQKLAAQSEKRRVPDSMQQELDARERFLDQVPSFFLRAARDSLRGAIRQTIIRQAAFAAQDAVANVAGEKIHRKGNKWVSQVQRVVGREPSAADIRNAVWGKLPETASRLTGKHGQPFGGKLPSGAAAEVKKAMGATAMTVAQMKKLAIVVGSVGAGLLLMVSALKVTKNALRDFVSDVGNFSGQISAARAIAEVRSLQSRINTAPLVARNVSRFIELQNEFSIEFREIKVYFVEVFGPAVLATMRALVAIFKLTNDAIQYLKERISDEWDRFNGLWQRFDLSGSMKAQRDLLKEIADNTEKEGVAAEDELDKVITDFLDADKFIARMEKNK